MEQSSVETLAIPLGLTVGLRSHGPFGTQLDHSSRTDGMYGWNIGFGLMDAGAMVRLALNWTTVPEQMVCMDGTLGLD